MLHRRKAFCSLGLICVAAFMWSGCEASKSTELIAGISTQVQVPRDLKTIRLDVNVGGSNTFCQNYAVYNGTVQLPRTLGTLPRSDASQSVTISVTGFTVSEDSNLPALGGCALAPSVGADPMAGGGARVLRISRQPYSTGQILYVPMPLKYACYDVVCKNTDGNIAAAGGDTGCRAGGCAPSLTDVNKLEPYTDAVLFGGDSTCFGLSECFSDAATLPPITIDDASCTYAIPGATGTTLPPGVSLPQVPGVSLPPDGLNVRIEYDGGLTNEILDLDADEGFFVPDATTPQIFKLAPGLCDLVHGTGTNDNPHRITAVHVNPVCRPKLASQSICAPDQLAIVGANPDGTVDPGMMGTCTSAQLAPVNAAVEFVVDPTTNASDFYSTIGSFAAKLGDPALKNLKIGVHFFPDGAGACPTTTSANLKDIPLTTTAMLAMNLASLAQASTSLDTAAHVNQVLALQTAYDELTAATGLVNKSVILVGHNDFLPSPACNDPASGSTKKTIQQLITANSTIQATVVEVGSGAEDPCTTNASFFSAVTATGGLCIPAAPTTDSSGMSTGGASKASAAILTAFTSAAACTYTKPSTLGDPFNETSGLWFSDPTIPGQTTIVNHTASTPTMCKSGGGGWTFDANNNLILCKDTCNEYQTALSHAAALASASASMNSMTATAKLPTIIPIFAMSGTACKLPMASAGMQNMSDGGSSPANPDAGLQMDGGTDSTKCGGEFCPNGSCCSNNVCVPTSASHCGPSGGQCFMCALPSDACVNGVCMPAGNDAGPACTGSWPNQGVPNCEAMAKPCNGTNTYDMQCTYNNGTMMTDCSCFQNGGLITTFHQAMNFCSQIQMMAGFTPQNAIMALAQPTGCNFGTVQ